MIAIQCMASSALAIALVIAGTLSGEAAGMLFTLFAAWIPFVWALRSDEPRTERVRPPAGTLITPRPIVPLEPLPYRPRLGSSIDIRVEVPLDKPARRPSPVDYV